MPIDEQVAGFGVWGDSAPYSHRDSLYLVLVNVKTGIFHERFVFAAWSKRSTCDCGCKGRCTFDSVWAILCYSMQIELAGEWPSKRHDNTSFQSSGLPGDGRRARMAKNKIKIRGGVVESRGDWQYYKQALGLQGWQNMPGARVCFKCYANSSTLPFTENGMDARWRSTLLTHNGFAMEALTNNLYISAIMNLPGFRYSYISIDFMHCSCLGIVQILLGNVLYEIFRKMNGVNANPKRTIADLLLLIHGASRQLGQADVPIHSLTLNMLKVNGKSPKLKTKAAEGRHLLPCVLFLLRQYFKAENEYEHIRELCVQYLSGIYDEFTMWTTRSANKIAMGGRRHILLYEELARHHRPTSCDQDWVFYRIYPKHHLFDHCVESFSGNLRESWCYPDESRIGECVKIGSSPNCKYLHRSVIIKDGL